MKTLFEKIIDGEEPGEFLFENDHYVIINNKFPAAAIHYLIIPKKAIPAISEIADEDQMLVGGLFTLARDFARERNIIDYKLVFNHGKYQHIPHLHLHFLAGELE